MARDARYAFLNVRNEVKIASLARLFLCLDALFKEITRKHDKKSIQEADAPHHAPKVFHLLWAEWGMYTSIFRQYTPEGLHFRSQTVQTALTELVIWNCLENRNICLIWGAGDEANTDRLPIYASLKKTHGDLYREVD